MINTFLFDGLSREEFQQVEEMAAESNRRSVATWSIVAAAFWIMSLFSAAASEDYAACRTVYAASLLLSIVTWLCARFLAKRVPRTLCPVMLLFELSLLGAGIGIALCQPNVRAVTMIAVSLIVPTSLMSRTITSVILDIITIAAYILLARNVILSDVYLWGLKNLIIFSIAGLLMGHVINKDRFERCVYAESVRQLAEMREKYAYYDPMTGLKNRRAYEGHLRRLSEDMPRDFCVVIADINGLKKTNDTYGHAAGDELITGASECLSRAFGGIDTIYRIGGDEFCVILPGTIDEARRGLECLDAAAANWEGRYVRGLSLSYGVESNQGYPDVDAIVKAADHQMYAHKRGYYMSSNTDRRKENYPTSQ